jgi:hypothetical protein
MLPLKPNFLIIVSITKQNKVANSNSPCLTPEFILICSVQSLLILTLDFVFDNANLILLT